jgi:uncharacterized SAM-binding protein YcdF (DUF218 family)
MLLGNLEGRYLPVPASNRLVPRIILVLGSGHVLDSRLPYTARLSQAGLSRMAEAARLQRQMPGSRLVFSGYGAGESWSMAKSNLLAAGEMGLDTTSSVILPKPWNTRDEAKDFKEYFGTAEAFYLVTNAAHMPRSMWHFRKAGLQPIPAPAGYLVKYTDVPKGLSYYMPSSENIRNMEIVFHEYLGILWARIGGD